VDYIIFEKSKPEVSRVVSSTETENLKTTTELRVEQNQLFEGVFDGDHPSQVSAIDSRRSSRTDRPVSGGRPEQFQEWIRPVSYKKGPVILEFCY
jgi:hypothetical protein